MTRYFAGVGAVFLLGALVACGSDGTQNTSPDVGSSAQSVRPTNITSAPPHEPSVETAAPAATETVKSAVVAAKRVMTLFAKPELGYSEWINGLYPVLSQNGASAYEDTDPSSIPAHQVTGEGEVMPGSTDVALIVRVPTDVGAYDVSLSRAGAEAPWLADRIRPVQG